MKTFEYTIKDELGIHARPAGLLVKEAKKFESECTITKDGKTKKLTQLMMLMSLGVKQGDTVTVTAEGADEEAAAAALKEFFGLKQITQYNRMQLGSVGNSLYNSQYINSIENFKEFGVGDLSGWMYKVNGLFPNYGCSQYIVKDGDVIEWVYTCDLGRDIGGSVRQQ